ncbi:hypothetical protein VTJ49DRAFT_168 [Mycothermus thermophilus]|uniref:U4/U6.U5 small nuclear ribonucleoprotein 27kDa protein domain-containing protein n=1 Tax=Humicola insolens TaxID=85995 RepID=A0ABR3VFT7_HUMIN
MADRRDGYSRRGDDRSHHDKDRRRDRDRDDRRDDSRRHGRERDRERDRDRDRDSRRYRSRSRDRDRDRGDRRRSRSPGRDRGGYDRRDRDADRDRGRRRRDEEPDKRGDRSVRGDVERSERGTFRPSFTASRATTDTYVATDKPSRDQDSRTPTEPRRRSASPKRPFERDLDEPTHLPTRTKPPSASTGPPVQTAPVSFKVKSTHSRDNSRGGSEAPAHREGSQAQEDHQRSPDRDQFDGGEPMDEDEEEVVVEDDGLDDMAALMGFGGFGSTKGKKVLGNNVGAARKEKQTKYRQYMNRVGGFNRPLSPTR